MYHNNLFPTLVIPTLPICRVKPSVCLLSGKQELLKLIVHEDWEKKNVKRRCGFVLWYNRNGHPFLKIQRTRKKTTWKDPNCHPTIWTCYEPLGHGNTILRGVRPSGYWSVADARHPIVVETTLRWEFSKNALERNFTASPLPKAFFQIFDHRTLLV